MRVLQTALLRCLAQPADRRAFLAYSRIGRDVPAGLGTVHKWLCIMQRLIQVMRSLVSMLIHETHIMQQSVESRRTVSAMAIGNPSRLCQTLRRAVV